MFTTTRRRENDRVLEKVSSMERKLETLAARNPKEDMEKSDGAQKMKLPTEDSTHGIESTISKIKQLKLEIENSTTLVPISKERFRLNAADFLLGASVDKYLSSRSSLNPSFGHDQTNLVLLDRPQPPADKAWCTDDKNPVLTIDLAKYIRPISVSYQHSKWNVFIPSGAPKTYDVVGCFDDDCKSWEPLASNCQYSQHQSNGTEQMCNISPDLDMPLIGKIQFRFRENYGHTRKTCVNLVRVYGETRKPLKMKKHLNSEKTCGDLKSYYHNSYIKYAWTDKNCSVLYENECCSECPECCQECLIHDYNGATFIFYCFWTLLASLFLLHIYLFIRYPAYRRWCRE